MFKKTHIMTINCYYHTFGFLVKLDDFFKHLGYTIDNVPDDWKNGSDQNDPSYLEDALNDWICDEIGIWGWTREFDVDGIKYIARGFTHDTDKENYVVVGIDLGSINRWDGTRKDGSNYNFIEMICTLSQNQDWIKMIQKSDRNTTICNNYEYVVQNMKYKNIYLCPSVYITTDDCDCCS